MQAVELKYQTPTGVKVAYAFIDENGLVLREKGLCELAAAVRAAPARPSAESIKAFLDLNQPCPDPRWEPLRLKFAAELGTAESAGCTKCKRSAISRKYAKTLFDLNL